MLLCILAFSIFVTYYYPILYLVLNRFLAQPTFGFTTQPLSAIYICILLQNSRMEQITEHGSLFNFVLIYHHVSWWFLQVGIKSIDPTLRNKYINIYIYITYLSCWFLYNVQCACLLHMSEGVSTSLLRDITYGKHLVLLCSLFYKVWHLAGGYDNITIFVTQWTTLDLYNISLSCHVYSNCA